MKLFSGLNEVAASVGTHLGFSNWHVISQDRVDLFAQATGDHQWIHVDVEKAAAGPFGGTIAHGFLTVALIPMLVKEIYRVDGLRLGVNYGSNRVRFPSPVPVGSRLRGGAELVELETTARGVRVTTLVTVQRDGAEKPACVAEVLSLLVADTP